MSAGQRLIQRSAEHFSIHRRTDPGSPGLCWWSPNQVLYSRGRRTKMQQKHKYDRPIRVVESEQDFDQNRHTMDILDLLVNIRMTLTLQYAEWIAAEWTVQYDWLNYVVSTSTSTSIDVLLCQQLQPQWGLIQRTLSIGSWAFGVGTFYDSRHALLRPVHLTLDHITIIHQQFRRFSHLFCILSFLANVRTNSLDSCWHYYTI